MFDVKSPAPGKTTMALICLTGQIALPSRERGRADKLLFVGTELLQRLTDNSCCGRVTREVGICVATSATTTSATGGSPGNGSRTSGNVDPPFGFILTQVEVGVLEGTGRRNKVSGIFRHIAEFAAQQHYGVTGRDFGPDFFRTRNVAVRL